MLIKKQECTVSKISLSCTEMQCGTITSSQYSRVILWHICRQKDRKVGLLFISYIFPFFQWGRRGEADLRSLPGIRYSFRLSKNLQTEKSESHIHVMENKYVLPLSSAKVTRVIQKLNSNLNISALLLLRVREDHRQCTFSFNLLRKIIRFLDYLKIL